MAGEKEKLNMYMGTRKPIDKEAFIKKAISDGEISPVSLYNKKIKEYEKMPWFFFFASSNKIAIEQAKKHNLKDVGIINIIWTDYENKS